MTSIFRLFPLFRRGEPVVQKANAPDAGNIATRSDRTQHVRGVEMANAHPICAAIPSRKPPGAAPASLSEADRALFATYKTAFEKAVYWPCVDHFRECVAAYDAMVEGKP